MSRSLATPLALPSLLALLVVACAVPAADDPATAICESAADHLADCGYELEASACLADPDSAAALEGATCEQLAALRGRADSGAAELFGAAGSVQVLDRGSFGGNDVCSVGREPDVLAIPESQIEWMGDSARVWLPGGGSAVVPSREVAYASTGVVLVFAGTGSTLTYSSAWAGLIGTVGAIPVAGQIALAAGAVIAVGVLVYTHWDQIVSFCDWLWQSAADWFASSYQAVARTYQATARQVSGWFAAATVLTPAAAAIGAGVAVEELIDRTCLARQGCQVFLHYTNASGYSDIIANQRIAPGSNGLVYVTWAPMAAAEAVQNLFLGRSDYADRGDYVVVFTASTGVVFTPAVSDPYELTYAGGSLRFARHIQPFYAGPNPFDL